MKIEDKLIFYGQGAMGLSLTQNIDIEEAQKIISEIKRNFPILIESLENFGKKAVEQRYLRTTIGRIKFFDANPDLEFKDLARIHRQGMNLVIQGGNADIIKYALWKLYTSFPEDEFKILLTVHDEIVAEVPAEKAEWYEKEMKRIMIECAGLIVKGPVKFDVSSVVKDSWTK